MFKTCQHCGNTFKGIGNFCSDMCEIKSYTPLVVKLEIKTIPSETKEEFNQVKEEVPETPIITNKVAEIKEKLIHVETDLGYQK